MSELDEVALLIEDPLECNSNNLQGIYFFTNSVIKSWVKYGMSLCHLIYCPSSRSLNQTSSEDFPDMEKDKTIYPKACINWKKGEFATKQR